MSTSLGNTRVMVRLDEGDRVPVRALDRVGPFAVHRGLRVYLHEPGVVSYSDDYTVTHVPTGLSARKGITRRRVARRIARALLDEIDAPWSSEDETVFLRYAEPARKVIGRVLGWR